MACKWPVCSCKSTGVKCKEFKSPKSVKQTSIRKEQRNTKELDHKFYQKVWALRPHFCSNPDCNKNLGNTPYTYYFDHILEKGSALYKHLRYELDNICILCIQCHTNKDKIPFLVELRLKTLAKFGFQNFITNFVILKTKRKNEFI